MNRQIVIVNTETGVSGFFTSITLVNGNG